MNDEKEYPDPESFKPERYINVGKNGPRNPVDIIFGFGRRFVPFYYFSALQYNNLFVEFVLVATSDYRTFTYLQHRY